MLRLCLAWIVVALLSSCTPVLKAPEYPYGDGGSGCKIDGHPHYGEIPATCEKVNEVTGAVLARFADYAGKPCNELVSLRIYWVSGPIDPWDRVAGVFYPTLYLMFVRTDLTYPGYSWQEIYQHEMGHYCLGQLKPDWGPDEDHCWMAWSGYMPLEADEEMTTECSKAGLWPPPGAPFAAE